MKKKISVATAFIAVLAIGIIVGAVLQNMTNTLNLYGSVNVGVQTNQPWEVHARIRMYQNGYLFFDQYHAGVVTDIGDNQTLAWIFGDSDYNVTSYMANATYISIGDQGSLSTSSTVLPGEWNRTAATVEDEDQSQLNMTCTFYPSGSGLAADCIGINWESTGDGALWAYDTFTEVTGIDSTFTINVEFQIAVSHT